MTTITTPRPASMPRYFTAHQRMLAALGLGLMPLVIPIVMGFFPALVGADLYVTAIFWLAATSALVRVSVPSLYLFNLYRRRLVEHLGVDSPTRALAFRRDSELATAFWLNVGSTVVSALAIVLLYL